MANTMTDENAEIFAPITQDRASQTIVDQIKNLLRVGKLKPGDRLPSERDLCQKFGVSRVTVREALRVLEASGLVYIRVGARGGAFVSNPSTERIGEGLADLLNLSERLTAASVTEARMIFEIGILPLACERATNDDVQALLDLVEAGRAVLERNEYNMQLSADFHIRVAQCTHNPAIEMLVQSFHGPLLASLREAQVSAPLMGHKGTLEHQDIAEAIQRRDPETAAAVMRQHLQRTASRLDSIEMGKDGDGSTD